MIAATGSPSQLGLQPPSAAALTTGAAAGVLAYGAMLEGLRATAVLAPADVTRSWATSAGTVAAALVVLVAAGAWSWRDWGRGGPPRRRPQALFTVASAAAVYSVLAFVTMHLRTDVHVRSGRWPAVADIVFVHGLGLWVLWGAGEALLHARRKAALAEPIDARGSDD